MKKLSKYIVPGDTADFLRARGRTELAEPAHHIKQHNNGAEPAEICPWCGAGLYHVRRGDLHGSVCNSCGWTGKLRHC